MSWDEELKKERQKIELNELKNKISFLEDENKHMKKQIESTVDLLDKIINYIGRHNL